jgi:hypothetical protein
MIQTINNEATMSIRSVVLATAISVASLTAAYAAPIELVTNGGFETGTFAGWTAVNNGGSGGCGSNVWEVNSTAYQGCQSSDITLAAPISGNYGAFHTFDGTTGSYTLTQQITVPGSVVNATLSFLDEFNMNYNGEPRIFSVAFYDATGSNLLGTVFSENLGHTTIQPWTSLTFDVTALLSAQAGNTIALRFTESIPQSYTGPAGFGLDNVSLQATVPEPGTVTLLGLGLLSVAAARRKAAKK